MREQEADTLAIVGSADSLGKRGADIDDAKLFALVDLVAERNSVGDNDLAENGVVENVDGVAYMCSWLD